MANIEFYAFGKDGNAFLFESVPDSWRGAPAIWQYLESKYLPLYRPEGTPPEVPDEELPTYLGYQPSRFNTTSDAQQHEVWDLVENLSVPEHERIVLFTTLSECLVKREDIPKVVEAFTAFDGETNLLEQGLVLEHLYADEDLIAVGWNQDSNFSDHWGNFPYGDESDADAPPKPPLVEGSDETEDRGVYNCQLFRRHYFLFDELIPSPKSE
jgi:hypothetical protein